MLNTSKWKYFKIFLLLILEKWQEASQSSSLLNKALEKDFCFFSAALLKIWAYSFLSEAFSLNAENKLFLWPSLHYLSLISHFLWTFIGLLPSPQQLETMYLNLLLFSNPSVALSGFEFLCWHGKSKQFFFAICLLSCQPKAIMAGIGNTKEV